MRFYKQLIILLIAACFVIGTPAFAMEENPIQVPVIVERRISEEKERQLQSETERIMQELAALEEQLKQLQSRSLRTGESVDTKELQLKAQKLKDKSDSLKNILDLQKATEPNPYAAESGFRTFPGVPDVMLPAQMKIISSTGSSGLEKNIVVIPSAEMGTDEISKVIEDMSIMIRIFDNKIGSPPLQPAYDRILMQPYIIQTGSRVSVQNKTATEGIYIAGYGALFLMNVDFLLTEPTAIEEKEQEKEVDTAWEQARREIFSQQPDRARSDASARPEFEREKVSDLKDKVIKTLKHTSNIRAVKPDEFITVSITGAAGRPTASQTLVHMKSEGEIKVLSLDNQPANQPTSMTIKIKKSTLDSFAKGDIELNEFTDKLEIISH